jgi:hypothetical protein
MIDNIRNTLKNVSFKNFYIRENYIEKVSEFINDDLPIWIKGNPWNGKTVLLYQIANNLLKQGINEDNIFFCSLKFSRKYNVFFTSQLNDYFYKYFNDKQIKGKIFVFIDDVSELVDYQNIVKVLPTEKFKLIFTSDVEIVFDERIHKIDLYPLIFVDFRKDKNKLDFILSKSCLPILNMPELEINFIKENVLNRIVFNITRKYQIKDGFLLKWIIEYLSKNVGEYLTIKRIRDFFITNGYNVNFETIQDYIQFLVNENYIYKVEKYQTDGTLIKNYVKLYPYDNIFAYTYNLPVEKKLEHILLIYFKSLGLEVFSVAIRGGDIPLVVRKNNMLEYFQMIDSIDNSKRLSLLLNNFKKIKDFYPKYFFTLDTAKIDNILGIKNILPNNVKLF